MTPAQYDAWYASPRGAWIGDLEYRLLRRMLGPGEGSSVLDVGCGTGYFSRRFARDGHAVLGVDLDAARVDFARAHATAGERYSVADALALPFGEQSFDFCVSVTALCFMHHERKALEAMARVTRRGVGIGLLNRRSLLFLQKGRAGASGAYRGARWHTPSQARALFAGTPFAAARLGSAVFLPGGGAISRALERVVPARLAFGAFLCACAPLARGA